MIRSRFDLFAALSLALHAGALATAFVRPRHPPASEASSAGGTTAAGGVAAIAGETFEVPDLQETPEEARAGSSIEVDGESAPRAGTPRSDGEAGSQRGPRSTPDEPGSVVQANGAEAAPPRETRKGHPSGAPRSAAGTPANEPPPLYGAVGDRSAGDLVTTFRRSFATAESSDPLWEQVPVGFYADGDVTFFLEADGSYAHATVSATAAPILRAAVLRTALFLKHRVFTAHGATTRTHVLVRVTDLLVNHGAFTVDAAGSFELPSGRHVSVSIVER